MTPTVTILTYCAHPALAYGTLLVFKTLRTGFPTARVEVYDNGSHTEVRDQIMQACHEVDADFVSIRPRHWVDHYRWLLTERSHDGGPLVLLDPDVALWENVEGWDFGDALMAGRLMKASEAGPIVSHARLHPSMLWIPDVAQLRACAAVDHIAPVLTAVAGRVHFWDTFAGLYEEHEQECRAFTPEQLDCFDHLFFGSHLPVMDALAGDGLDAIREGHRAAQAGDMASLRGIWRKQDAYFDRPSTGRDQADDLRTIRAELPGRQLASAQAIQAAQGMTYPEDELRAATASLQARMTGQA